MRRADRQRYRWTMECAYKGDNRIHNNAPGMRKWGKTILARERRRAAKHDIRSMVAADITE